MFKGILINKDQQGYHTDLTDISNDTLPEGDVSVSVSYSSLNYKDALAITGKATVVRVFPMIPGIDLVGTVTQSQSNTFAIGDTVLLNGFGIGEKHCGGLAQTAQLKSEWLIELPSGLSPRQAMIIGTAGYTAMLSVMALENNGVKPEHGEVIVTGANGGVGSFAIAILAQLGYTVIASTRRTDQSDYLKSLGAHDVIDSSSLSDSGRPMVKERWAGAIDSVGSHTLANICASMKYGGTVTACGLAQGMDFPASVAPFILRGITLVGIDSVMRPLNDRREAWQRLAALSDKSIFDKIASEIKLDQVITAAEQLLEGKIRGRVVVNVRD